MQPYRGVRENGALGLVQGIGKGLGGFVLKDLAAIIGPFGYTLKGVHKELIKGRQPIVFIRKARMIQGGQDASALGTDSRERELTKVEAAWRIISEIRREDEARKEEGLKGRIAVLNNQRKMGKNGAFETVGQAKKVLEAKREDRQERQSVAVARVSNEGRRGSKMFGKNGSLPKPGNTKIAEYGDGASRGADRDVKRETLDVSKEKPDMNGHAKEPETSMYSQWRSQWDCLDRFE